MLEIEMGPTWRRMLEDRNSVDAKRFVNAQRAKRARPNGHLDFASTQLHQLRAVIGNEADDDLVELRGLSPVIGEFLQHDLLFWCPLDELHRTGTDQSLSTELGLEFLRTDRELRNRANRGAILRRDVGHEGSEDLGRFHDYRAVVWCRDIGDLVPAHRGEGRELL